MQTIQTTAENSNHPENQINSPCSQAQHMETPPIVGLDICINCNYVNLNNIEANMCRTLIYQKRNCPNVETDVEHARAGAIHEWFMYMVAASKIKISFISLNRFRIYFTSFSNLGRFKDFLSIRN